MEGSEGGGHRATRKKNKMKRKEEGARERSVGACRSKKRPRNEEERSGAKQSKRARREARRGLIVQFRVRYCT